SISVAGNPDGKEPLAITCCGAIWLAALRWARSAERSFEPAHPCLMKDAFGRRCSSRYSTTTHAADVARQPPRRGRGILGGSSRSIVPHIRSARASGETSDDRECPESERVGRICCRNKHPDRGSDSEGFAPSRMPPSVDWQSIPLLGVL